MTGRPRLFAILVVGAAVGLVLVVLLGFHLRFPETAPSTTYLERPVEEAGATNRVAGIYLNYRLYDSLLEVLVFFLAVLGVRHSLAEQERTLVAALAESEVVRTSAALLVPLAFLLGVYLAGFGQISPGGGFGAGVMMASGLLLASIAVGVDTIDERLRLPVLGAVERGALLALLLLALLPLLLGRQALTDLLPRGRAGTLLSGGMIPIYNVLIALKVLTGSWLILRSFVRHRGEL